MLGYPHHPHLLYSRLELLLRQASQAKGLACPSFEKQNRNFSLNAIGRILERAHEPLY